MDSSRKVIFSKAAGSTDAGSKADRASRRTPNSRQVNSRVDSRKRSARNKAGASRTGNVKAVTTDMADRKNRWILC